MTPAGYLGVAQGTVFLEQCSRVEDVSFPGLSKDSCLDVVPIIAPKDISYLENNNSYLLGYILGHFFM